MARQSVVGRTYSQISGVLFSLLLAFPTLCLAQAGAIVATAGDNSVVRAQAVITPLKPGIAVQQGDSIVTAPAGRLQVRFADGAFLSMQPNTRFQIDEHRFSNNEERSFLSLLRGAIRMASGLIGKRTNEDFKLNTPSATIGIRGTHFVVEHTVCDPLCSPGTSPGTRIAVTEGRVIVSNDSGTIELGQNESALIENHSSLPQFIQWKPQLTPRSIELPAGPPGQPSAPAAPGRTELNIPATSSPTDQPID
ncbi:MAG: FecR domain-containing protein, partial [Burkholderiaceae bacterium]